MPKSKEDIARKIVEDIREMMAHERKKNQDTEPEGPKGMPAADDNQNETNIELGNPLHDLKDEKWNDANTYSGSGDGPPL
jgi:hypothetical protein